MRSKDGSIFKCLKCGAPSKTYFHHLDSINRNSGFSIRKISVPVCENCYRELTEWTKNHSISRSSYSNLICSIFWMVLLDQFY